MVLLWVCQNPNALRRSQKLLDFGKLWYLKPVAISLISQKKTQKPAPISFFFFLKQVPPNSRVTPEALVPAKPVARFNSCMRRCPRDHTPSTPRSGSAPSDLEKQNGGLATVGRKALSSSRGWEVVRMEVLSIAKGDKS